MALFKPYRGARSDLPAEMHDGYAYFCTDDGSFHIDFINASGNLQRKQINAQNAQTLAGKSLTQIQELTTPLIITGSYIDNYLSIDGPSRDTAEAIENAYETNRPMKCIITINSIAYHLQFEYLSGEDYHFGLVTLGQYHHVIITIGGGRVQEKSYTLYTISMA